MSNTINPQFSVHNTQFQHRMASTNAVNTGAAANTGKEATKTKDPADQMDGILKFERYPNGITRTEFQDGSYQLKAPNGAARDISAEGEISISLPNGMMIEQGENGIKAYNPVTGSYVPAEGKEKGEDFIYTFKDSEGNKWDVNYNDLSFAVQNGSETLTQYVDTEGGMSIDTKTLSRDPVKGRFSQDRIQVLIEGDGQTRSYTTGEASGVKVDNKGLSYNVRDDLTIHLKFPYGVPQALHGDCVVDQLPPAPPQSQPHHPGSHAPQDSYNPGIIGQDPWAPPTMPNIPGYVSNDPYAPQMTPSGLMRKTEPDGSMFISLQNGIVMNQRPDGTCEAFDHRDPKGVFPVNARQVNNPQHGPETRFDFADSVGNVYTLYSKSPDFAVSSRDGNVMQTVDFNGNMMINARTYPLDANGMPTPRSHHLLLQGGNLNTFGERGVQLGEKNVVFAENGQITNYPLPYEIPKEQSWLPYAPPVGFTPAGSIPVQDPNVPSGYYPGQEPDFPQGPDACQNQGKPNMPPPPCQQPVKPGIWQRIKNFFNGDGTNTCSGNYNNYFNNCCHNGQCNMYPGNYYNPNSGMSIGKAALVGAGVGLASMMISPFMWPMGMYCSPFMGSGMEMGLGLGMAGASLAMGLSSFGNWHPFSMGMFF